MWRFTPFLTGPPLSRPPDGRARGRNSLALVTFAFLSLELSGCGSFQGFQNRLACNSCGGGGGGHSLLRNGFLGRRNGPPSTFLGAPAGGACCEGGVGGPVIEGIPAPITTTPSVITIPSTPGAIRPGSPVPPAEDVPTLEEIPGASPTSGSKSSGGTGKPNYQAARPESPSRLSRRDGVARSAEPPEYTHPLDALPPLSVSVEDGRSSLRNPPVAPPAEEVVPPRSEPSTSSAKPAAPAPAPDRPEPAAAIGDDVPESVALGVRRFRILEPQLAGGSFPTAEGLAWLRDKGYRTLLDLREPAEVRSADIAEANRLGLRHVLLPVSAQDLGAGIVGRFETELADAKSRPLYFCDGDGTRAGALWYVHRIARDKVAPETAAREAEGLGLTDPRFLLAASAYLDTLKRGRDRDPETAPSSLLEDPAKREPATAPDSAEPPPPGTLDLPELPPLPEAALRDEAAWKLYAAPLAAALCVPLAYWTSATALNVGQKIRASLPAPPRSLRSLPAASDARS